MFSQWEQGLPPGVEVCPLQPPGREERQGEAPMTRVPQAVELLGEALAPLLDRPFALFGYSVGALTMFEWARTLRRQGARSPEWLFVAGHPAPDLPQRRPAVSHLPQPEFWRAMHEQFEMSAIVLRDRDLQDMLYPVLRADYELVETYACQGEAPLAIPISVFGGSRDPETTEAELLAWRKHTTSRFRCRILEGNHTFISKQRTALVHELAQDLSQLL
jgi:medium-chain acyl-[acyl-carrier-protein] hydrolase